MAEDPREMFKRFEMVDCAVRSAEHLYLVASHVDQPEDEDDDSDDGERAEPAGAPLKHAIRIGVYFPSRPPEKKWAFRTLRNIEFMKCAVADLPAPQLVSVSLDGQVFGLGSGASAFEDRIPEHRDGPLRGSVRDVLNVGGLVYAVQGNRGLCRRVGPNRWESLCAGLPVASTWQRRDEGGFTCADATSAKNLYAGGGNGDLWHFDGQSWTELCFPSNVVIEAMCCAGEKDVYVGCQSGIVYRGHGDVWKKISDGNLTLPFKNMVSYQGKIWCSSDNGMWTIDGDRVEKADVPVDIYVKAGVLATRGNVLLTAGTNGAAYHDGARWHEFLSYL